MTRGSTWMDQLHLLLFPNSWEIFFFLLSTRIVPRLEFQFSPQLPEYNPVKENLINFWPFSLASVPCATSQWAWTYPPEILLIFSSTYDLPIIATKHFHCSDFRCQPGPKMVCNDNRQPAGPHFPPVLLIGVFDFKLGFIMPCQGTS